MSAPNGNVYRVQLTDPGGRTTELDVPAEDFEATERGIVLSGRTTIPWHRVVRYTREMTSPIDDAFRTHTEVRVWIDDGTPEGETIHLRADRFEQSEFTVDLAVERALNVEAGIFHLTKIYVPWSRVLEFERMPVPVDMPGRPD
jgi:uncharacterized protein (UPF0248 family)